MNTENGYSEESYNKRTDHSTIKLGKEYPLNITFSMSDLANITTITSFLIKPSEDLYYNYDSNSSEDVDYDYKNYLKNINGIYRRLETQ